MTAHLKLSQRVVPWMLIALFVSFGESVAAGSSPNISLNVKVRTERSDNETEEINEDNNGREITTTTETETELCTLTVRVRQRGESKTPCQLEWCFLSEKVKNEQDKGETVIFSPGRKKLSMEEGEWHEEKITSKPFVMKTITKDTSYFNDKISGDQYEGYIVLVTQGGEILARASNSDRYLDDEWISRCRQ